MTARITTVYPRGDDLRINDERCFAKSKRYRHHTRKRPNGTASVIVAMGQRAGTVREARDAFFADCDQNRATKRYLSV